MDQSPFLDIFLQNLRPAQNQTEVEALINEDPFAKENLILSLSIHEWDPLFGTFAKESSQNIPPAIQSLFEDQENK